MVHLDSWFMTPCRVTGGCQCYGGTHCPHLRGLRIRYETDAITVMMQLLYWHVMKKGRRNFSQMIDTLVPLKWHSFTSLICHIFPYFLTHTKHTYGPCTAISHIPVSHLLLTHTRLHFPFLLMIMIRHFPCYSSTQWNYTPDLITLPSTLKMETVYSLQNISICPQKSRNVQVLDGALFGKVWWNKMKHNRRVPVTY